MDYLAVGVRFLLGTVFVVAAYGKVRAYGEFVESLRRMRVVPPRLVAAAAAGTVGTEILIAVLMATPWPVPGFILAAVLLGVFTVAIGLSVRRGTAAPCRCFGRSDTPLGVRHMVRNCLLIGLSLLALFGSWDSDPIGLAPIAIAGFAGLIAGAIVTMFDDLVALFE